LACLCNEGIMIKQIAMLIPAKLKASKSSAIISAAKAVTWRLVGTLDTWAISYLLTGMASLAFSISVVEIFTKTLLYYMHERGWEMFKMKEISILPINRSKDDNHTKIQTR
jgi:uncharacterized membrane protein